MCHWFDSGRMQRQSLHQLKAGVLSKCILRIAAFQCFNASSVPTGRREEFMCVT